MNEFENGFHNENLENNRINNQENNSQQVAIDVTPIEESVTQENTESHRYSYREQGTGGSSYQYDNGNNSNDTYNNSYSSHGWRDESTYNNENYYFMYYDEYLNSSEEEIKNKRIHLHKQEE